ncbi:MAG: glycosyltransferase family 39 protein [Pseudomonadota bacterium]
MTGFADRHGAKVLWGLSLLLLVGAFFASTGLYNIDEAIYLAAMEAMSQRGSLTIENGYEQFQSDGLRLWFLVWGPNGLTPQYPPGTALAGGLFHLVMGTRGPIVLSALAAIATLFVTRAMARDVSGREDVALLSVILLVAGSFWIDYVYAFWPHALSVLIVACAVWCTLRALPDTVASGYWAGLAGLAVGLGLMIRTDTVLILPTIGVAFLIFAARPWRCCIFAAIGMLPGCLIIALVNDFKFGTFNPISYGGHDKGGISLSSHIGSIAALGIVFVLLLVLRRIQSTARLKRAAWGAGVVALVAIFLVPKASAFAEAYLLGLYRLVIDLRAVDEVNQNIVATDDGTVLFWGLAKKALGQSMPWIGALTSLAVIRWPDRARAAIWIFLVAIVVWTLPFAMRSWHGGLGNNMRYFLPLVPMLAVLGALVWHELGAVVRKGSQSAKVGLFGGVLVVCAWSLAGPGGVFGLEQIPSTILLIATALSALLLGLPGRARQPAAHLVRSLGAAGFVFSMSFATADQMITQTRRNFLDATEARLAAIPSPSVIIGLPELYYSKLDRSDALLYMPDRVTGSIDGAFLDRALTSGYRIFASSEFDPTVRHVAPHLVPQLHDFGITGMPVTEFSLRTE